ncbi:MAG: OsmC family protein [Bacteroidales bacterium]|nr:OsmC family protein [Bacteroidales bacterium]
MKTTAKWIEGNQYVLDNNRYFRLAMIDQRTSEDMTPSCLDLMLMGFAGCITSAFRTQARLQGIHYKELDTEISIEFTKTLSDKMQLQVNLKIVTGAPEELIDDCMSKAVRSSLPGILFRNAGIKLGQSISIKKPMELMYY